MEGITSNGDSERFISRILVAVRTAESRSRVEQILAASHKSTENTSPLLVDVIDSSQTPEAIQDADIVLLGFGHGAYRDVLQSHGIQSAIRKKGKNLALVSMLGGVSILQLSQALFGENSTCPNSEHQCGIIRALPNVAARVCQSMTALSAGAVVPPAGHVGNMQTSQVDQVFRLLGQTTWLSEQRMNTAGALCASSLAFYASIVEAMAEGASDPADGLESTDALAMAAFASHGVAALLAAGQSPDQIRHSVITQGGSTAKGMQVMHELGVAEAVKQAVRTTALVARGLAKN